MTDRFPDDFVWPSAYGVSRDGKNLKVYTTAGAAYGAYSNHRTGGAAVYKSVEGKWIKEFETDPSKGCQDCGKDFFVPLDRSWHWKYKLDDFTNPSDPNYKKNLVCYDCYNRLKAQYDQNNGSW